MKLFILFFSISLTAYALEGRSQQVTLRVTGEPLAKVLDAIYRQSGYNVIAEPRLLQLAKPVTLQADNEPLAQVLERCFAGQPITYTLSAKDKAIVVREVSPSSRLPVILNEREGSHKAKLVVSLPEVRGKVVDSTGVALSGASVRVLDAQGQRTSLQTQTDRNGEFMLRNVPDDALLEISYIGYIMQQLRAAANVGTIILREVPSALQEVAVNAGYWTVKDRERTGNISRVTAEEIDNQPVSNPLASLIGRMPGVNIIQNNGIPGGGFTVEIRGRNSLRTNGNFPLFIVDGVPFTSESIAGTFGGISRNNVSPLNSINPADIESIEVLKDADATSIYGSRGANGVVLITTRKGKSGKTTFDLNVQKGIGQVSGKMDLLSTPEYIEIRKEALQNDGLWPLNPSLHQFVPDIFVWDTTRYTDWQEELIGGTANTTNAHFSVMGGDANTNFLFSGNYYSESSAFPGDFRYQRGSGHFNFSHNSRDHRFRMNVSSSYSRDDNNLPGLDLTYAAVTLPPNAPALYTESGEINWENSTWSNPLAEFSLPTYKANNDNFIVNTSFGYEIIKGLSLKLNSGLTRLHLDELGTNPTTSVRPNQREGFMSYSIFGNNSIRTWIIEPQAQYEKSIGKGILTVLTGITLQETLRSGETIIASGYSSDAMLDNIMAATDLYVNASTQSQYRYSAVFARINYSMSDKYFLNFTGRRDGSSRFGPGKQYANFGAIGAAWIFSNESFAINALPFISFGKLRASLGTTGSDNIGDYQFLDTYRTTTYPYAGTVGLIPSRLFNADYSWETNTKLEAALEIGLLKDRLFLSSSWYRNTSGNQLVGYPLSIATGMPSIQYNLPATVENSGWEFTLTTTNIKHNNFSWTTNINATLPQNVLLNYSDLKNSAYADVYIVGKSLYAKKGYVSTGLDPETGLFTYKDINGDESISYPEDYVYIGDLQQTAYGGVQNIFRYGNFQLDFLFQFVKQNGNFRAGFPNTPGSASNVSHIYTNRWRKPGDVAPHQKVSMLNSSPDGRFMQSDLAIVDASFIRLKNISLLYNFPDKISERINLRKLNASVNAQNLLTFSDYPGVDPEGQNSLSLPPLRVISLGLQVVF